MSFARVLFLVQILLSTIIDWNTSYSLLIKLLLELPFSRKHETEADYIGLLMMADACYLPSKALDVWKRMERVQQGQGMKFFSTHPPPKERFENIQGWLPEAESHRESHCGRNLAGLFRTTKSNPADFL